MHSYRRGQLDCPTIIRTVTKMQDRYSGDIGDYIKLALLRRVAGGKKLGIAWYKTPDSSNNDGRHISYLDEQRSPTWSRFDHQLHVRLKNLVKNGQRSIRALEGLFDADVKFHDVPVPTIGRAEWFATLLDEFRDRELVFVDPDNGIRLPREKQSRSPSRKHVTLAEIWSLHWVSKPVIIYHHQTRFKGGHIAEIEHIGAQFKKAKLGCILALRARCWSPRVFFIVGATHEIWASAEAFAQVWSPYVTFHAIDGPPDVLGMPPSDPYSIRAERAIEAFADRLSAGEFDHLFPKSGGFAASKPDRSRKFYDDDASYFPEKVEHYHPPDRQGPSE